MIISPLTLKKGNSKLVESFDSNKIIERYNEIGVDVKRFFDDNPVRLYKCQDTGYRYYYPYTTVGDAKFYKDLSMNRVGYYSNRWEHGVAMKYLSSPDYVLEIGSGFGSFLMRLDENEIRSRGLELNPHAVEICKDNGLDVNEKLIQQEAIDNMNSYNAVCCFQVLEHITEVNAFIKASIEVLKPNGKLIIGVPNNNPYLFISDKFHTLNLPPHHAGLWDKKSLKSLEKVFPLKLISMEFEPLENTYDYFFRFHRENSNYFVKTFLRIFNKVMPKITKLIICKLFKGRNVLAIFRKLD